MVIISISIDFFYCFFSIKRFKQFMKLLSCRYISILMSNEKFYSLHMDICFYFNGIMIGAVMRVFVVSDNSFFLLGFEDAVISKSDYEYILIHINEENKYFYPSSDDIIVISVENLILREKIMKMDAVRNCRILMMLSGPLRSASRKHYPWLIRNDIKVRELLSFINRAKILSSSQDFLTIKIKDIFLLLGCGVTAEEIAANSLLPVRHIYQIKRTLIKRYGLMNCNSLGVLICRDIIYTTRVRDNISLYPALHHLSRLKET